MEATVSTANVGQRRENTSNQHVISAVTRESSSGEHTEETSLSDSGHRSSLYSEALYCGRQVTIEKFSVGRYAHNKSENYPSKREESLTAPWVPRDFSEPRNILGSGKFADVHLCIELASKRPLALKKMEKENTASSIKQFWKREVEIQTRYGRKLWLLINIVPVSHYKVWTRFRLSHENILKCHGYFQTNCYLTIVLEHSPCGDLATYLETCSISISKSAHIIKQITSALKYLNLQKIAHRDVKTENVLLMNSDTIKLADFGFAVDCRHGDKRSTSCGTLECLPPELLLLEEYHALSVDSWSLGVLAYEVVVGKGLFVSRRRSDLKSMISGFRNNTIEDDPYLNRRGPDFRNFVCSLLQKKPINRATPSEAFDHIWFIKAKSRSNKVKFIEKLDHRNGKKAIGKKKHQRSRGRRAKFATRLRRRVETSS